MNLKWFFGETHHHHFIKAWTTWCIKAFQTCSLNADEDWHVCEMTKCQGAASGFEPPEFFLLTLTSEKKKKFIFMICYCPLGSLISVYQRWIFPASCDRWASWPEAVELDIPTTSLMWLSDQTTTFLLQCHIRGSVPPPRPKDQMELPVHSFMTSLMVFYLRVSRNMW